jgi:nucleoside-diphosphate kinase
MSDADQLFLCRTALANIALTEQLIDSLTRSGYPLLISSSPTYSQAWDRVRGVLAQIPADWETVSPAQVGILLHYGQPVRPKGGVRQKRFDETWETIRIQLRTPCVFFSLVREAKKFGGFGDYVTASPLIEESDRLAFLTFVGLLKSVSESLEAEAVGQMTTLARQCGVIAGWVEKYADRIAKRYESVGAASPLQGIDRVLDSVLDFVNVYPKYMELVQATRGAFASLKLLQIAQTLGEKNTKEAFAVLDSAIAANALARQGALQAEECFRRKLGAKKKDPEEVDLAVSRIRAEEHTYAMIKPGYEPYWGKVVDRIIKEGLKVLQIKSLKFDGDLASRFYAEHVGKGFYANLAGYMTSGTVVGMELVGPNAVAKWRQIIGPTKKEVAVAEAPNSLRALYARSTTENLCHGSDSPESAARELALIFPK